MIHANGGTTWNNGAGGGGGRVALYYNATTFTGTVSALAMGTGAARGGAGTVYRKVTGQTFGTLDIDNGSEMGAATEFSGTTNIAGHLVVHPTAWISHPLGQSGCYLVITGNATIAAGARIDLTGRGYAPQGGPGAGLGQSGGGHGGRGGLGSDNYAGGNAYGSITEPVDLGSGGGNGYSTTVGGRGGGAIRMDVGGTLDVQGSIVANGGTPWGFYWAGGGAGGSIYLTVGTLAGAGTISADGGLPTFNGANPSGTGAGGRIAVYYNNYAFAGQIHTRAADAGIQHCGGAGTLFLKPSGGRGTVIIDAGGVVGEVTEFTSPLNLDAHMLIRGSAVAGSVAGQLLDLTLTGDLTVESDGKLSADAHGYGASAGPGTGTSGGAGGGGGGHGGLGGDGIYGLGGPSYGGVLEPTEYGSGGANCDCSPDRGGAGGGAMRLTVGGALQINGVLSADGQPGGCKWYRNGGGGGAGGSLQIRAAQIAGQGTISAAGGEGSDCDGRRSGGGGGGGRIAIQCENMTGFDLSRVSVRGGQGFHSGSPGTLALGLGGQPPALMGPDVQAQLVTPPALGRHRAATLWLEYEYHGEQPIPAPLITVQMSQNALLTLDPTQAGPGLWTDDPPYYLRDAVQILALGGGTDPTILNPGDSGRVPVYYRGLRQPWDMSGRPIEYAVTVLGDFEAAQRWIDWGEVERELRPADADPEIWNPMWANLKARIGDTWSDYLAVLRENVDRLQKLGELCYSARDLFKLEVRRAYGLPVSAILGRAVETGTNDPLADRDIVAARVSDGERVVTSTDGLGEFRFKALDAGNYALFVTDCRLTVPAVIEVPADGVVADVLLTCGPRQQPSGPPPPLPEANLPQHRPAVTTDDTGVLHMVWQVGDKLWHAQYVEGTWNVTGQVADAVGTEPRIAYGSNLIRETSRSGPGLVVVWEAGFGNQAHLMATVGASDGANGMLWSTPTQLTFDDYGDTPGGVVVLSTGDVVVMWSQRDWDDPEDDSDLYYMTLATLGQNPRWWRPLVPPSPPAQRDTRDCVGVSFAEHDGLSMGIPLLGGTYGFNLSGDICGGQSGCGYNRSGQVETSVQLGRISFSNSCQVDEVYITDRNACGYVFESRELSGGFSSSTDIPLGALNLSFGIASVEIGAHLSGAVAMAATWNEGSANGRPDSGSVSLTLSAGPYGEARILGVYAGPVSGTGSVRFRQEMPEGLVLDEACLELTATVQAGILRYGYSEEYCAGEHELSLDAIVHAITGSGAVHEGIPVDTNVHTNVVNEYSPFLTSCELVPYASWCKPEEVSTGMLGRTIGVSSFNGSAWSPVTIIATADTLNDSPAMAFTTPESGIVAFSSSPIDYDLNSDPNDIIQSMMDSDILVSTQSNGIWSPPVVHVALPGQDGLPAVAASSNGMYLVAWVNRNNEVTSLYASLWDGSAWTTTSLSGSACYEQPSACFVASLPLVTWVQDLDGDPGTPNDLALYSANWAGSWSTPHPVVTGANQVTRAGRPTEHAAVRASQLPSPPSECCKCNVGEKCCEEPCDDPDNNSGNGTGGAIGAVGSFDPNLKLGPAAVGTAGYVPIESPLPYTIYFENQATATAAALEVHIADQLDSDLDWSSTELLEMGFGSYRFAIPVGAEPYSHTALIDGWTYSPAQGWHTGETPLQVTLTADVDTNGGLMTCNIVAVDPQTGLPPEDPYAGFLPPNDPLGLDGRGDGYVSYTTWPHGDRVTGTEIRNQASIIFDANPAISTPQTLHTIDRDSPTSVMSSLPPLSYQGWTALSWSGSDQGSGISRYRIYVSVDGAAFGLWAESSDTTATFAGQSGHSYAFCSLATDGVGNREIKQLVAEATIAFQRLTGDINFDGAVNLLELEPVCRVFGLVPESRPPAVRSARISLRTLGLGRRRRRGPC